MVEALVQMQKYAKFIKELLTNKRKLPVLHLIGNILCCCKRNKKLSKKLKDPGSFTFLCVIGELYVNKAPTDLGASINLMTYAMFKKFGFGTYKNDFAIRK